MHAYTDLFLTVSVRTLYMCTCTTHEYTDLFLTVSVHVMYMYMHNACVH